MAGVYGVSEAKLMRVLGCRRLALAPADAVRELTQAEVGYAGPVELPDSVEVIWDLSTEHRSNFEAGANRTHHHSINLNFGRDVARPPQFHDIRESLPGERCAQCDSGILRAAAALVLGHASDTGESTPTCWAPATWTTPKPPTRCPRFVPGWISPLRWPPSWSSTTMPGAWYGRRPWRPSPRT